jgi:hypothetical protein
MPLLCLLAGFGFAPVAAGWRRHAASGLIALSILIHGLGAFGHSGYTAWHQRRHQTFEQTGPAMFDLRDSQIEAHARAVLHKLTGPWAPRKTTSR